MTKNSTVTGKTLKDSEGLSEEEAQQPEPDEVHSTGCQWRKASGDSWA